MPAAIARVTARGAPAGGTALPNVAIESWTGTGARVRFLPDGTSVDLEADGLVIAETAVSETALADELRAAEIPFHLIGDAVAPRRASLAFYEGRELGRRL